MNRSIVNLFASVFADLVGEARRGGLVLPQDAKNLAKASEKVSRMSDEDLAQMGHC